MAYRILVYQSGIEPLPPVVEVQSSNHWTIRKSPRPFIQEVIFQFLASWDRSWSLESLLSSWAEALSGPLC